MLKLNSKIGFSLTKYIILFSLFIGNTLTYGQGISVSPSRIALSGQPGQTVSQAITFTNTSDKNLNFISSLKDWDRDEYGIKRYYPAGQLEHSNSNWISLSSSSIQLAPGESKVINVNLRVPDDSKVQLTNSMLFFTQVNEQKKANNQPGLSVNVVIELGIQVYNIPAGLERGDLEFLAFEDLGIIVKESKDSRRLSLKIKNTGGINKEASVRFELTNIESGQEIPVNSVAIAMLPDAEQWINLDLPSSLTGKYLIVAILDAGTQYDLKIAEKEILY